MQGQRQTQLSGFASQPAADASPLSGYRPAPNAYDELVDPRGGFRARWLPFASQLERLGTLELKRRWAHSQRLIHANGVAYSPHRSSNGRRRPWTLDPFPLIITSQEWKVVAEGLAQRARVLELALQDLYGPQTLIRDGVLPAELLYCHPGYLLPLRRRPEDPAPPAAERMLRFYAADLGRAPDGSWWVLSDRTESPSGIGFALENRIVVSRMMPEPFRDCRALRLAGHFAHLREVLGSIAPQRVRNPGIAILSQGPGNPNYFEDAYLARYLGYMLVEGEDLTVRQRRLWLKTLEGLVPIDVLVRRPNSEHCDPLELGGESPAGVAGLIQAARGGALSLVNPIGSGLVESPVFMAFLPRLCQKLLGEKLKLPGVATWWCGEQASLEYVTQNIDRLILKRAYRLRGEESLLTAELHDTPREQLIEKIRQDPRSYVAQERVERSSAPRWEEGRVQTCRVALRAFATADAKGEFKVLEGALARTTSSAQTLETSVLSGEGSKDVWITSELPVEAISLLSHEDEPVALVRFGAELPSRVADNSYWLGRNLERADAKARLVRTVANRLTGENDPMQLVELPYLLRALADEGLIEPGYAVAEMRELLPHVDRSLPSQVLNSQQPSSLAASVENVFHSAAKVRDRLSRDAWRLLLRVSDAFRSQESMPRDLTDLINATDELIADLAAIGGLVVESMTRTQFYRFLDIGRRLERAAQLVELLTACLIETQPSVRPLLEALLETSDSIMTYRSRYRSNMRFVAALDLLLTDQSNPRSLAFQLDTLERHIGKLPRSDDEPQGASLEQRLVMSMTHAVRMADVEALAEAHEMGNQKPLAELLEMFARDLPALSNAIALKYLVHAGAPRQLSPL